MSVEITMTNVDIELSEQDLDAVSGGVSLLESTNFKQHQVALASVTGSGAHGSNTATDFAALSIDTSAFKILKG